MIVGAIVLFLISLFSFVISVCSFMKKGFLVNNAYIYAFKLCAVSKISCAHYRQSGIVFLCLGLVFLLNGFNLIFKTDWILYLVVTIAALALVYAIVSSILIEKNKK